MKRIFGVAVFIFLLSINALAEIPAPGSNYANDYANVLSQETENHINETSRKYSGDGTQVVVVTVTSLDGMDIETYANRLFRSWGIGSKERNNGMLILVSTGDRKMRIEVGTGLEGTYNDAKCGRLMDAFAIPHLKNNDYDTGIRNLYDAIIARIEDPSILEEEEEGSWAEIIIPIIMIILYIIFFTGRRGGRFIPIFGFHGGGGFRGGSSGGFGGFGGGSSGGGGASRGF